MSQLDEFNQNNILFKRYQGVINTLIEDQPSNDYTAEGKSALENVFNDDIFTSVVPRDLSAAYYLDSLANGTNGAPNLPDTSANCWDTGIYSELTSLYDASNNIVPHLSFFKRVPLKTVSAQSPNAWWLIDPSSSTAELTTQNLLKHMIPFSYGSVNNVSADCLPVLWSETKHCSSSRAVCRQPKLLAAAKYTE